MLDEVGVIHMNGRIYDPKIARFLQADPFIQSPTNTQSLNRYSYVLNNPLNATDPSGYFVFTLASVITSVLAAAEVITLTTAIIASFAIGFTATLYYGGDFGDAFLAGVSAAAMTFAGGKLFPTGDFGFNWASANYVLTVASIGGITASLQGGKFGHGFRSAGLGAALGGAISKGTKLGNALKDNGRAIARMVVGGTVTKLSGGKFANGAATAALAHVLGEGVEYWKTDSGTLVEVVVDPKTGERTYSKVDNWSDANIEKLFVNGQSNDLELAVKNGYDQLGNSNRYHVFHNPTHGGAIDTVESALGKQAGASNLAKELANLLVDNASTLQLVAAHSQGAIITSNALKLIPNSLTAKTRFNFYGPAASEANTRASVASAGGSYGQWKSHKWDFVGNILGHGARNSTQAVGSILAFPLLFMGPSVSPHSTYYP